MNRAWTNSNLQQGEARSPFLLARNEIEGLLRHFGFRETPFGVTPDPEFLFWSEMHRSAFHGIVRSIESNLGFSVLIGDPGTGKTTLLFELLTQYRSRARTAFIFQTQCRPNDLLRYIASEFELPCARRDEVLLHQELKAMLIREATAGRKVLIIVDEAQNLQPSALEAVRLLCDFQTPPCKLLHVILAGSPRLGETLLSPDLSQLAQRITTIYRLEPLSDVDIKEYVKFRLGVAGVEQPEKLFSSEALAQLAVQSRGVPRLLNAICHRALARAYRCREQSISGKTIEEAARDIDLAESHRSISGEFANTAAARLTPISHERYQPKQHKQKDTPDTYLSEPKQTQTDLPHKFAEATRVARSDSSHSPQQMAAQGVRPETRMRVQQRWNYIRPGRMSGLSALNLASRRGHFSTVLIAGLLLLSLSWWVAWNGLLSNPKANGGPSKQNPPESLDMATAGSVDPAATEKAAGEKVVQTPGNGLTSSGREPSKTNTVNTPPAAPEKLQSATTPHHAIPVVDMLSDSLHKSRIDTLSLNTASPPPPGSMESASTASNSTSVVFADIHPTLPRLETTKAADTSNSPQLTAPRLTTTVQPDYPDKARLYHIQGEVLLEIAINRSGEVESVRPLSGHPILIQAAEVAVRQWHYLPSTRDNVPVPAATRVRFNFKLNPEGEK